MRGKRAYDGGGSLSREAAPWLLSSQRVSAAGSAWKTETFRAGLAEYIASDAPVAITRHGQTVGFFIPARGQAAADLAALKKASAELDRLLAARSVDVDEVAVAFKAARKAGAPGKRKARGRAKA